MASDLDGRFIEKRLPIADSDYSDFFDLLAKLGLGFWDDEDEDDEE